MKTLFFISLIIFSLQISAKEVRGHFTTKDYDSGIKNTNKLTFEGESTKMGLITTKWHGVVKDFNVKLDENGKTVKDIEILFPITSMDTDNSSRNDKMQNHCLGAAEYKDIKVKIPGPIILDGKENKYPSTILIRGQEKPVDVTITANLVGEKIIATGSAQLSFKNLEIPDPSIFIAKVNDVITVIFAVEIE